MQREMQHLMGTSHSHLNQFQVRPCLFLRWCKSPHTLLSWPGGEMQSAAAWQQHWCRGINLGEQHKHQPGPWKECSIFALSFLGVLPSPSRAVLAAQL